MISAMRSIAPKIMLVVLIAFIGTIFLDWGMNRGSSSNRMTAAGKINGKEIPLTYFDRQVNEERQNLERTGSGAAIDPYQLHMVTQQVWEKLVSQYLLEQFIRKVNLYGSADQVFDYIKSNPLPGIDTVTAFKTNGVFDTSKYIGFLNNPETYNYHPWLRQIEQYARLVTVPLKNIETLLSIPLVPMKTEIEYLYRDQMEKAVFEYAFVKNSAVSYSNAKVTDDMVASYYNSHRDDFKSGEQANLYYVSFSKAPTQRDEQVFLQELQDIKKKVLAEKDVPLSEAFGEEAKVSSDDESNAKEGGDLGWVTQGSMDPAFDSVAFKLDTGHISDPVKTQSGYHLIYIEKKAKEGKTEKIKARHILRKIVATMETIDLLTEKADTLRRKMVDEGFVKAAREFAASDAAVKFDSTGFFTRDKPIPGIGYVSGVGKFAFGPEGKEDEAVSERLENSSGIYLFALKQKAPEGVMSLAIARPRIMTILLDSLHKEALRAFAVEWSKSIGQNTPLASCDKADSTRIRSGKTDTVTRASYIKLIGMNSAVAAAAFALPVGKRSGLVEQSGTFYIVRPLWKGPAVTVPWTSPEISMIANQIMSETMQKIYLDWYMDLKKQAKIIANFQKIYLD